MNSENILPAETMALVRAELRSKERLSWVGQPIPGRLARKSIAIVLFGIPWTAFAIFWIVGASAGTSHISTGEGGSGMFQLFRFFPLFGVPFVLIGFGMLTSPFWMYRKASRTAYAITDQRAIIIEPGAFRGVSVRSFEPARLHGLRRVQNTDGSGDIIFEREWQSNSKGGRQGIDIGFLAIADVKRIEDVLRAMAAQNLAGNS